MKRVRVIGLLSLALALAVTPAASQDYETTEIGEGVYQFRWIGHNGLFVVTDGGVVAVDPIGVEAAQRFAMEIQRIAPGLPIAAIAYSHSDADHATGAAALLETMGQDAAPIIAHERAAIAIAARGSADQPMPTVTFAERLSIQPGGRVIEFHYLGPSHTDNIIVPFIPDTRVAFAVDFVARDRMGYQDLASWQFPEFFDAVTGLLEIPFETIVFGHGPTGDRASIQRQIAYYDDLRAAVTSAIEEGLSEDQAAERVRLPSYGHWGRYDDWFPMNVRGVYRWLSSRGR